MMYYYYIFLIFQKISNCNRMDDSKTLLRGTDLECSNVLRVRLQINKIDTVLQNINKSIVVLLYIYLHKIY